MIRAWLVRLYDRLVRLHGTPEGIAGGVAIGVAIAVAPTFGLGLPLAAALSVLLKRNMAAAMVGTMVGVPPVVPVYWVASCVIGGRLLGLKWGVLYATVKAGGLGAILHAGWDVLLAYLAGNVILTAAATVLAYVVVLKLLRWRRRLV